MVRGPPRVYFLETNKSILVMSPQNVPQEVAFFLGYGLQIVKVSLYLVVLMGTNEAQDRCLGEKVGG